MHTIQQAYQGLVHYVEGMSLTAWLIVLLVLVVVGSMCLRGPGAGAKY